MKKNSSTIAIFYKLSTELCTFLYVNFVPGDYAKRRIQPGYIDITALYPNKRLYHRIADIIIDVA